MDWEKTDGSIITASAGFTLPIKGKKRTNNIRIVCNPKDKALLSVLSSIWQIKPESYWLRSIPECVFEHLPPFLNEVVNNSISVDDRDTILIGAIVCLSVCFHNVCGVYDERIVYPNLYLFVVADAGMGKGAYAGNW